MSNLYNNSLNNLKLKFNYDEYWDFFLNKDSFESYSFSSSGMDDDCLISFMDFSLDETFDGDFATSLSAYTYEDCTASSYDLKNIGFTGIDDGLIKYRKDRISNSDFVNIFTGSTYHIDDSCQLKLHKVSGNTLQYEYPLRKTNEGMEFNGGWYQGFFRTECGKYSIWPISIEDSWNMEFVLKPQSLEKESGKTLNDKYPNNKGIFFYIGTRSENKWIYLYDTSEGDCFELSPDEYVEDASIDKSTYIINNFFGSFNDFTPSEPKKKKEEDDELSDFISYNYYDPSFYSDTSSLTEDFLFDYVNNEEYEDKIKTINENLPHVVIGGKNESGNTCSLDIFQNSSCKEYSGETYNGNEVFGNDYIEYEYDNSGYDYIEEELDISSFTYETSNGYKFSEIGEYEIETDNKFLMFDNTKNGYNVKNFVDGDKMIYYGKKRNFNGNLFLYMNRTETGYTVSSIETLLSSGGTQYDVYSDLYNNALAFRIKDDGSIGYRYIVKDCSISGENKTKIMEGYSFENVVKKEEWNVINVRIRKMADKMKIYFYVNGKLVYITSEMDLLNLRKLDLLYEKQEGVPFNVSIGGGSQGLSETILTNYMLNPYRTYPIEENFAGSFIGTIKSFKFYSCFKEYNNILDNFKYNLIYLN